MAALMVALALMSGAIGAGFASGREIVRFFAGHGRACGAALVFALLMLGVLLLRLPAQLEKAGCRTIMQLCRAHLGAKLGALCGALFFSLYLLTGGAMLAACAELISLALRLSHAYTLGLCASLLLAFLLSLRGISGLTLPGAALCALLPMLLFRLLALPAGEACFLPAMAPDLPVRAAAEGAAYGALNAALLSGCLPLLLHAGRRTRRNAALLFSLLFGAMLALGAAVCLRHLSAVWHEPMPFVALSRRLYAETGFSAGYGLTALCLYAAACSSLLAMLVAMAAMLPFSRPANAALSALLCLLVSLAGFAPIVETGYPTLGALCAGLLLVLCLPLPAKETADCSQVVAASQGRI